MNDKERMRVDVNDRRYTVVMMESGKLKALRYGEEWRDCVGDNLIYWLACKIDELREEIKPIDPSTEISKYGNCAICDIPLNTENIAKREDNSFRKDAFGKLWCQKCTRQHDGINWDV